MFRRLCANSSPASQSPHSRLYSQMSFKTRYVLCDQKETCSRIGSATCWSTAKSRQGSLSRSPRSREERSRRSGPIRIGSSSRVLDPRQHCTFPPRCRPESSSILLQTVNPSTVVPHAIRTIDHDHDRLFTFRYFRSDSRVSNVSSLIVKRGSSFSSKLFPPSLPTSIPSIHAALIRHRLYLATSTCSFSEYVRGQCFLGPVNQV